MKNKKQHTVGAIPKSNIDTLNTQIHDRSHSWLGAVTPILASIVVDREFESLSDQTKDYTICISCFSANNVSLRRKNKDWLALNQYNV
jgi:hypothetical protein